MKGPSLTHLINACHTKQELAELAILLTNAGLGVRSIVPASPDIQAFRVASIEAYKEAVITIDAKVKAMP